MLRSGDTIGGYTLIEKLGSGGFGAVWLAEKRSHFVTKKVAVKLPHEEQVNFDAIRQEATLWEQASGHPNVLPIIDADIYDGQVLIVSEYADGGSLADQLKEVGTTSVKSAVELTIGILNGLEFLHGRGIIHRDIKPQNILLQGNTPRLADFGISRAMQTTAVSSTVIGTDAYMSPEAFDGKRNIQTDIWSVGVVLYQLLKGGLPFPQEHPSERMFAVLTKEFEPLPDDVPASLRQIVHKALEKLPENRYQTTADMRDNLQRALVGIAHPTLAKTEVLNIRPPDLPTLSTAEREAPIQTAPPPPAPAAVADIYTPPSEVADEMATVVRSAADVIPTSVSGDGMLKTVNGVGVFETIARHPILLMGIGFAWLVLCLVFLQRRTPLLMVVVLTAILAGITALILRNRMRADSEAGRVERGPKFLPNLQTIKDNPFVYAVSGCLVFVALLVIALATASNRRSALTTASNAILPSSTNANSRSLMYFKDENTNKYGFKDGYSNTASVVIGPKYDDASTCLERMCGFRRDGKYGFVDEETAVEVVPARYDSAMFFQDGVAPVKLDGKAGFIDKRGNVALPFIYEDTSIFADGLAAVKYGGKYGYIDKTGTMVIAPRFTTANTFNGGVANVSESSGYPSKYGLINKSGTALTPFKYDMIYISGPKDELIQVKLDGKWGYINRSGVEVISIKYDETSGFYSDHAKVKLNGRDIRIDRSGIESEIPVNSNN